MFEGLWHPLVSKVAGIGSPAEVRSWDQGSSDAMHTPDVIQQILSEIANWNLKNVKFWGMDEGALPPMTPVNPYLGGNVRKKWATFYLSVHLCTLWKPHFGAKYGPRGPSRAIYEPGGPGCRRDTYCIKKVKVRLGWVHLKWKNVKNGVETMSFGRKWVSSNFIQFWPTSS